MAVYSFFPTADKRQDEIWNYTVEKWGEEQAENYLRELHVHLQQLADRDLYWHSIPNHLVVPADVEATVFFSRYEKHCIFFRELSNGIGIMSILHESMNIPVRLKQDLKKLQGQQQEEK